MENPEPNARKGGQNPAVAQEQQEQPQVPGVRSLSRAVPSPNVLNGTRPWHAAQGGSVLPQSRAGPASQPLRCEDLWCALSEAAAPAP